MWSIDTSISWLLSGDSWSWNWWNKWLLMDVIWVAGATFRIWRKRGWGMWWDAAKVMQSLLLGELQFASYDWHASCGCWSELSRIACVGGWDWWQLIASLFSSFLSTAQMSLYPISTRHVILHVMQCVQRWRALQAAHIHWDAMHYISLLTSWRKVFKNVNSVQWICQTKLILVTLILLPL